MQVSLKRFTRHKVIIMAKINVKRKGCFVTTESGDFVELQMGEQEVSDKVAAYMCSNKYAVSVIEETKETTKAKK